MAQTANERLAEAAISHAVDLSAYSNSVVRRLIALLNRTDSDLFGALMASLSTMDAESFTVERLEGLLTSTRALNAQAYQRLGLELESQMRDLVDYEAGHQLALFESVIPPQVVATVGVAEVQVVQVYAAAMSRPFQGRLLREWSASLEADRMVRIRDAVRMGYVQQETIDQIIRRIRGTKAKGYSDGIIEIDRRAAEAVARTAVSHVAGFTRDRFFEANQDLIASVQWSATLDSRTTPECRIRDGKRYTCVDHKPIGHQVPWMGGPGRLHWRCRSSSVPITKSWRDLGVDIDDFSPSTRASMDGQVPADLSYGDWLKRQSAARQDEIVGPTRGALMRAGKLPFESLYTNRGQLLTLEELRSRDAAAFRRAGL